MGKGKSPLAKKGQLWFTYSVTGTDEVANLIQVQADSLKEAHKRLPKAIEKQLGLDVDYVSVNHVVQGKVEEIPLTAKELEDILSK